MREDTDDRGGQLLPRALRASDWLILAVGMVVTSFLSVGAHDLAISHLGVPYPHDDGVPAWVKYLGQFVRFGSVVIFCRLAAPVLDRFRLPVAAALVGALIMALAETLRVIAITWVILDGSHGLNGVFVLLNAGTDAIYYFYQGAIAAVIARYVRTGWGATLLIAVLAASLFGAFALRPLGDAAMTAIQNTLHITEPPTLYNPPYGWNVYRLIYGMFVEPGTAALLMAALVWPRIGKTSEQRVGLFVLLMLFLRGRMVSELLSSFWLAMPLPTAFAAEGQFFVETLILALLSGLLWDHVYRRRVSA